MSSDSPRAANGFDTASAPVYLTRLIGRDDALRSVVDALSDARLVSLVGPGGAGKTRLAAELTRDRAGNGSTAWVSLAALTSGVEVPRQAAAALGLRDAGRQPDQAIATRIGSDPWLLVLDNCEHLLAACARLAEHLLATCPGLSIVATTREPLGVSGERVWSVPPLLVPAVGEDPRKSPSVRLFAARATDAVPSFRLDESNIDAVARICRQTDGLPLAIELAAARVGVLPPAQLSERLEASLEVLSSRAQGLHPRHRTLRAIIEWSYSLLTVEEQHLFERLSVFRGGFTLAAAERVGRPSTTGPTSITCDVLDGLAALVAKSLVTMREIGGEARYSMLETVRRYAAHRLALRQSGPEFLDGGPLVDAVPAEGAHARFYADFVRDHRRREQSGEAVSCTELEVEESNLVAALRWALDEGRGTHEAPALALRLCVDLADHWRRSGRAAEALDWTRRALAACRGSEPDEAYGRALVSAALHARHAGEYLAIGAWLDEAERLTRASGDHPTLVRALTQLGLSERDRGSTVSARRHLDEAVTRARDLNEPKTLTSALGARASVALAEGDTASARALRSESASIASSCGDREAEAHATIGLGEVERMDGNLDEARTLNRAALALFEQLGDRWHAAAVYHNLGWIEAVTGHPQQARVAFSHSVRLFRSAGNPFGLTLCLYGFARLLLAAGDAPSAAAALEAARAHAARVGVRPAAPADVVACQETENAIREALSGEELDAVRPTASLVDDLAWAEARLEELLGPAVAPSLPDVACPADGGAIADPEAPRAARPAVRDVAQLSVRALGPLEIAVDGEALDPDRLASSKPAELLLMMLCSRAGVGRDEVGLAFWPDASPAQVKNSFHVMLHRLRRALGRPDWIIVDGERYRLDPTLTVWFDVTEFDASATDALRRHRAGEDATEALTAALELYRGDFFEGMTVGDWHLVQRDHLARLYRESLHALAARLESVRRLDEASQTYHSLLGRDRLDEVACRGLMRCEEARGYRAEALRVYETFKGLLADELGTSPDAETTALADRIRQAGASPVIAV